MSARLLNGTDLGRYLATLVIVAGVYYIAGRIGLELAYLDGAVAALWPPAGIGLAVLFLYGIRLWPAIVVLSQSQHPDITGHFTIPVAVTPSAPGSLLLCGYTDDGGAVTLATTSLILDIKSAPAHRRSLRKAKARCRRLHSRRARARCLRRVRLRAG